MMDSGEVNTEEDGEKEGKNKSQEARQTEGKRGRRAEGK